MENITELSKKDPFVSVIIAIRNVADVIEPCLVSLLEQTYQHIEIIVVDNDSTDNTKQIVSAYSSKVIWLEAGPERCAQRNSGAHIARGDFLLFLDADMSLEKHVIEECVYLESQLVVIPEITVGQGFWSRVRQYERSFYQGEDWLEAGRFIESDLFHRINGYDENLIAAGEDWDLHRKAILHVRPTRAQSIIYHHEGKVTLHSYLTKKRYYARFLSKYTEKWGEMADNQLGWRRITIYFRQPVRIIKHPVLFLGMCIMLGSAFFVYKTYSR